MQEHHGFPRGVLLPEGIRQLLGALFADALHLGQPLRMLGQDVQGALTEFLHQQLRRGRPDAADQAGAQKPLDAKLPLPAVLRMLHPLAQKAHLLPRGQRRQDAHRYHLVPARTDFHNRITIFLIAENGVLDHGLQAALGGFFIGRFGHACPPSVYAGTMPIIPDTPRISKRGQTKSVCHVRA